MVVQTTTLATCGLFVYASALYCRAFSETTLFLIAIYYSGPDHMIQKNNPELWVVRNFLKLLFLLDKMSTNHMANIDFSN